MMLWVNEQTDTIPNEQADTTFFVPSSKDIKAGGYSKCTTCTDTRGIKRAFDDLSVKHATLAGVLIVITVLVGTALSLKYFDGKKK